MRALIFNAAEISFVLGPPATRPEGLVPEASPDDARVFRNVAVAFLCVVAEDIDRDADRIVSELARYGHMVGRKLVLVPFCHLASHLAPSATARRLLRRVREGCAKADLVAGATGFGYQTGILGRFVTLAHERGVAFRDSRFPNRDGEA